MAKENISQEFILNEIDKTRNYFIEQIKQNESLSKKCKKICKILSYTTKHLLILASLIAWCVSISAFPSLVGILMGIAISETKIKNYVITAGMKEYKSKIIEKIKKKDKIMLLAKTKLNTIKVCVSNALIDSFLC